MAANMYRVGDYVYFETSSTSPYQIRRVEELIKTPNGNVEAKVMCFYRRRDISSNLMALADKHQTAMEEEEEEECCEMETLTEKERHQLQHRELFLSRQVETLPATHIRGKCSVTLLNETEARLSYLNKEDSFFYSLVYDPQQKTLLADRGEIRVGSKFQAEVPPLLKEGEEGRSSEGLEVLAYNPEHGLSDRQIDQFLIICRSVGTFARALDCSSSVKQPSLHMSAAAASRDITLFHAMDLLHRHNYNMASAIASLVPPSGPVLCRDEMEEWSASEANLFEEALEKYGKDFSDIRQDFLPWKSLKNIVEYYYMWKTTDRYVQQKRVKAVEAESKLKQVYIPNYSNTSGGTPGKVNGVSGIPGVPGESPAANGRPCESCYSQSSSQWYAWGPAHMQCRLCQACWLYWKKYGGLKYPTRLETLDLSSGNSLERLPLGHGSSHRPHRCSITGCGKEFKLKAHLARHCATAHGLAMRSGSPRPIVKTRAAFYLCSSPITKLARRLCSLRTLRPRHTARNPFLPLNFLAIKQECQTKLVEHGGQMPVLPKLCPRERGKIVDVSVRLGTPSLPCPDWLRPTPKDSIPQPEKLAFPPPPRGEDGQFVIQRAPVVEREDPLPHSSCNKILSSAASPSLLRKRTYDLNGTPEFVGAAPKRRLLSSSLLKTVPDIYSMSSSPSNPLRGTGVGAPPGGGLSGPGAGSSLLSSLSANPNLNSNLVSSVSAASGLNGRAKVATVTRVGGRKQMISWVDAPDDLYFMATDATRRLRRQLSIPELRRAARHPCCRIHSRMAYNSGPSMGGVLGPPLEQRAVPPPSLLPTTQPESIVILD